MKPAETWDETAECINIEANGPILSAVAPWPGALRFTDKSLVDIIELALCSKQHGTRSG